MSDKTIEQLQQQEKTIQELKKQIAQIIKDNKLKDIKILIYNNRELVSIKNKE